MYYIVNGNKDKDNTGKSQPSQALQGKMLRQIIFGLDSDAKLQSLRTSLRDNIPQIEIITAQGADERCWLTWVDQIVL